MATDPAKVKSIFLQAVEHRQPAEWKAFLDQACVDHPELRREVEILLEAHAQAGAFLESGTRVEQTISQGGAEQTVPEQAGAQIGPYKLLQQIGEGGMGVVYMGAWVQAW